MSATDHPLVEPDSFVVYPSCWDRMGNSDRDAFCLTVVNGHAYGWSIRRGRGGGGPMAMNRRGEWVFETRGGGRNKPRRWPLEEALEIALRNVDRHLLNGMTAEDCARRWPRDEDQP